MTQISNEVDYKSKLFVKPTYRMSRVLPYTGGQSFNVGTGGGVESTFEIPTKVFNLSRSHLYFTMTAVASGAAGVGNWAFTDCVTPIRQIQLYTRGGIYLCDLDNVPNYTKIVSKPETKLEEFLDYDFHGASVVYTESVGRFLCRNNTLQSSATKTLLLPYGKRHDNSNSNIAYTEPKYLEPGTLNTADPNFVIGLPLKSIKNTIFALDKDILLNEIVILRIVWSASNRIYFTSGSVTDPTAAVLAAYAQNVAIDRLALYLAIEKEQTIINELQSTIASPDGMKVLLPYVYQYKQTSTNSTSHTISYRFNRGHGIKLLKIYNSAFNTAETVNTAYDHDNRGTTKVNVFYTMLDNERIQEYNLTTSTFDDYLYLRPLLKGSVIQSADIFYYNWLYIEDFSGIEKDTQHKDILDTGLDLSVERKWDFYAMQVNNNVAAQYNYYTFVVTQKMLTVTAAGITVI